MEFVCRNQEEIKCSRFLAVMFQRTRRENMNTSNIRHVLNAVSFLLANSSASEFYMATFRYTLSVPSS